MLQSFVACGWVLCLLVAFGTIFATYPTFTGHAFGTAGNVLYGCLRHVSWAGALAWIIYCCCHHYAGIVFDICCYPSCYIYLARLANLPKGLYILLALIFSFLSRFLTITWRTIISGSAGPIFAIFH